MRPLQPTAVTLMPGKVCGPFSIGFRRGQRRPDPSYTHKWIALHSYVTGVRGAFPVTALYKLLLWPRIVRRFAASLCLQTGLVPLVPSRLPAQVEARRRGGDRGGQNH